LKEGTGTDGTKISIPQEKLQHQTAFSLLPMPLHIKKEINHLDIQIHYLVKIGKGNVHPL